jgi:hypothetical protein
MDGTALGERHRVAISAHSGHKYAATLATGQSTLAAMNASTDDDLLLDLIETVTLDVLARIGDDPEARFRFFRRFVELAQETVRDSGRRGREPTAARASAC